MAVGAIGRENVASYFVQPDGSDFEGQGFGWVSCRAGCGASLGEGGSAREQGSGGYSPDHGFVLCGESYACGASDGRLVEEKGRQVAVVGGCRRFLRQAQDRLFDSLRSLRMTVLGWVGYGAAGLGAVSVTSPLGLDSTPVSLTAVTW